MNMRLQLINKWGITAFRRLTHSLCTDCEDAATAILKEIHIMKRCFILLITGITIGMLCVGNIPFTVANATDAPVAPRTGIGPRSNTSEDPINGIYVSIGGNDATATGAIAAPYQSINAALASAQPGDTIILRNGTYREGSSVRIRNPNITIKSAKGEWAIIDLTSYNSNNREDSGVYFDVDSSGSRLQGVEVIGGFYAVSLETRWDWGDPANRTGASDIVIEDCILHDSQYDVIKVKPNCDNIIIRFNEIYNSGIAYAGGSGNAEGIDNVNGDRMTVQNNYIHDICSTGIYAKGGATDALIENNRIERTGEAGILVGFDTSPEFFDTKENPEYYESIRCTVRNNLVIDTGLSGIGLYAAKDSRIHNNTLINVAYTHYHSAIYFGVTFQDWETYAGRPGNINPSIYSNIIRQPIENSRPIIEIRYANELGGLSALDGNLTMSNNCYFHESNAVVFSDRRPYSTLENAGLAAWQNHINSDIGSLEADPMLDADYLTTNPLCAGMGITTALDFDKNRTYPTTLMPSRLPSMQNFAKVRTSVAGEFIDIDENSWYGFNNQQVVAHAYEYDLISGYPDGSFNPTGNMTIAEAIAIAARVHSIYGTGTQSFDQGSVWYQVYVDYAISQGIITSNDFSSYTGAATRAEIAYVFYNSIPTSEYYSQNIVNSLPDVDSDTPYQDAIIALYDAGILTGNNEQGKFNPNNNISRAEAAAIITRIIVPSSRSSGNTFGSFS